MSTHIGDLVIVTQGKATGEVGIVLDSKKPWGPSRLKIKLPNGATIIKEITYVQKLGDNK